MDLVLSSWPKLLVQRRTCTRGVPVRITTYAALIAMITLDLAGVIPTTEAAAEPASSERAAATITLPFEAIGPVARVDGVDINAETYNAEVSKFARLTMGKNMSPAILEKYKEQLLSRVVEERLLDLAVEASGIKVSNKELDIGWSKFTRQFNTPQLLELYLTEMSITREQLRANIRRRLSYEKLITSKKPIKIRRREVKAHLAEHIDRYRRPARVNAAHILFAAPEGSPTTDVAAAQIRCQEIASLARVKDADFVALGQTHSDSPEHIELGEFDEKRMIAPFSKAAFALKAGEVSGCVKTQFGFHIIKVFERHAAIEPDLGDKNFYEHLRDEVFRDKLRERSREAVKELEKKHSVELLPQNIELRMH